MALQLLRAVTVSPHVLSHIPLPPPGISHAIDPPPIRRGASLQTTALNEQVSKKQHEALLRGLFVPRPGHTGISKAGSSEIDSSSESRMDQAIVALLGRDAKRGSDGFDEVPVPPRNLSDSSPYPTGVNTFSPVPQQPSRPEPPRVYQGRPGPRDTFPGQGSAPLHRPPVHRGSSVEEPGHRSSGPVPQESVPPPGGSVGDDGVGNPGDVGMKGSVTGGRYSFEDVRPPWSAEGVGTAPTVPAHHVPARWGSAEPDPDGMAGDREGRRSEVYEDEMSSREDVHVPAVGVVKVRPPVGKLVRGGSGG